MHFCQIAASCLLTYIYSFLHAALWFNQGHYFQQETHPLTFLLQNYDANLLRNHGLHWQQT